MAQTGVIMQIQSQQAGSFPAETAQPGGKSQQNGIPLLTWSYSAAIPVNQVGVATGPRRYSPVSFDKSLGAASPYLLKAMLTGDQLAITVDVLSVAPTGAPLLIHRVTFTQARILSIVRKVTAPAATGERVSAANPVATIETVTFDFRAVEFDPGRPGGSLVDEIVP
jgi:type VI secretion system Hcp family effector